MSGNDAKEVENVAASLSKSISQSRQENRPEKEDNGELSKRTQRYFAFGFGVVFLVALIVLAIYFPNPPPFQYTVFRIVLSLACAGAAAMFPGFIQAEFPGLVRAGGAMAVFVLVFFYNPASLVAPHSSESPEPFEQARSRSLLVGYDGAFALAKAIMGEDFFQDRSRIDEHLRRLRVEGVAFPADPTGPDGTAEAAAVFARTIVGILEARDARLKAAFVLGWFGVISTNTPSIKPAGFSVESAAREAGFASPGTTEDGAYLEELVRDARFSLGN